MLGHIWHLNNHLNLINIPPHINVLTSCTTSFSYGSPLCYTIPPSDMQHYKGKFLAPLLFSVPFLVYPTT